MINIDEILIIGLINEDYFANELKNFKCFSYDLIDLL